MAHNKVYTICEDKCWEESLTKEQIVTAVKNDTSINDTDASVTQTSTYSFSDESVTQYTITDGVASEKTTITFPAVSMLYSTLVVSSFGYVLERNPMFTSFDCVTISSFKAPVGSTVSLYFIPEYHVGDDSLELGTDAILQDVVTVASDDNGEVSNITLNLTDFDIPQNGALMVVVNIQGGPDETLAAELHPPEIVFADTIVGNLSYGSARVIPNVFVDAPLTPTSPGTVGQMAFDSGHIYVCVATNTWRRDALVSWT